MPASGRVLHCYMVGACPTAWSTPSITHTTIAAAQLIWAQGDTVATAGMFDPLHTLEKNVDDVIARAQEQWCESFGLHVVTGKRKGMVGESH